MFAVVFVIVHSTLGCEIAKYVLICKIITSLDLVCLHVSCNAKISFYDMPHWWKEEGCPVHSLLVPFSLPGVQHSD